MKWPSYVQTIECHSCSGITSVVVTIHGETSRWKMTWRCASRPMRYSPLTHPLNFESSTWWPCHCAGPCWCPGGWIGSDTGSQ